MPWHPIFFLTAPRPATRTTIFWSCDSSNVKSRDSQHGRHTFTPTIHPRYQVFDDTQYASIPVPLSCFRNHARIHRIITSTFAKVPTTFPNYVELDQHRYYTRHSTMSVIREKMVEIKDNRRQLFQKWSAGGDIHDESWDASGTLRNKYVTKIVPISTRFTCNLKLLVILFWHKISMLTFAWRKSIICGIGLIFYLCSN